MRFERMLWRFAVFALMVAVSLLPPATAGAGDEPGTMQIPGYEVLLVKTPENTVCLKEGGIVVLGDKAPDRLSSMRDLPVRKILIQLPPGWTVEVTGPRASAAEVHREHQQVNERLRQFVEQFGCPRGGPGPSGSPGPGTYSSGSQTYAMDANNDPATRTLVFQSADWTAPTVGTNQDRYSVFTTNVDTETYYFLQVGNVYFNGTGAVVYTSTGWNYFFRYFNLPYVVGNRYYHYIYYSRNSAIWYMGVQNETTGAYDYVIDPNATGTRLQYSNNTGVFFENFNAVFNWYYGFTNPLAAYDAWESEDPYQGYIRWGGDRQVVYDCQLNQVPNDVITGSLANGGTAFWALERVRLACY